jgi:Na+/proline symporter
MWFLILFGIAGLVSAVGYARRPTRPGLQVVIGPAITTLMSICTGTVADLAAVGHKAPDYVRSHPNTSLSEVLLAGVGESMSPAILGFSLLTTVALVASLGMRRSRHIEGN